MYDNKSILAVIPARGGSKRLPYKNILELNGVPLIAWSIDAGLKSKYIDKLVVSSDDQKIIEISKRFGANTIVRPAELANDTATTIDVLKHVIDNSEFFDYIVLLQPTSPLRKQEHIDAAIELLFRNKADSVVSVCKVDHSPLWCNTLPSDDSLEGFIGTELQTKRSQDLDTYYRLNGAIYIWSTTRFVEEKIIMIQDNIFAYKMEREVSVDIDTALDFKYTEFLLSNHARQTPNGR